MAKDFVNNYAKVSVSPPTHKCNVPLKLNPTPALPTRTPPLTPLPSARTTPPAPHCPPPLFNAQALIAGAFVCGLGVGVYYDSEVVLSPQNLSSTQIIDRSSPNSDVCMAYGEGPGSACLVHEG